MMIDANDGIHVYNDTYILTITRGEPSNVGPGLDTNDCPIARGNRFWVGASKKLQTMAPWAIASICSISNFNDCHNRQRISVASRASDKLRGQVP